MIFFAEIIRCNIAAIIPNFLITTNISEAYNHTDTVVLVMTYHETRNKFVDIINHRKNKKLKTKIIFDRSWETGSEYLDHIETEIKQLFPNDFLYVLNDVVTREGSPLPDYCKYLLVDLHGLDAYNNCIIGKHPINNVPVRDRKNGLNLLVGKLKARFSRFVTLYYFYKYNLLDDAVMGIHATPDHIRNKMDSYTEYNDENFYKKIVSCLGPADNASTINSSEGLSALDGWPYDCSIYSRSSITYTCETFDYDVSINPHLLNEKFYRPILNKHPFIVQGSPGQLQTYRNFGYQTFSDIIDESYNDILCEDRSHVELAIKASVEFLTKLPYNYDKVQEIVDYNFNHFCNLMDKEHARVLRAILDFGYTDSQI